MKKLIILLLINSLCLGNIDFDGTDDIVNCGTNAAWENMAACSFAVWIYPHTVDTSYRLALGNYTEPGGTATGFSFSVTDSFDSSTPNSFFVLRGASTNQQAYSANNTLDLNEWNIIIASCPGLGTVPSLYHGSESSAFAANTEQLTDVGIGPLVDDSGNSLYFGDTSGTDPFDGLIGCGVIWDVALTSQEAFTYGLAQMEGIALQIQPSNLIGYWTLDEEESGTSCDGDTFINWASIGTGDGTGDDGGNNTGLTAMGEDFLSYP